MPRSNYRVRLVRGGDEFEAEGDKSFVLAMLQRFEDPSKSGKKISTAYQESAKIQSALEKPSVSKPVSVGEFIRQLAPKMHTDMVLAFGYFLEKHSGVKDFTAADINRCYYEAKLETSNTSQMITRNIRRSTIMEVKSSKGTSKKRYTLTQTGEDKIRTLLSKVK